MRYISIDVELNFEEAVLGSRRDLTFSALEECSACHGSGAEKDSKKETCSRCHGMGVIDRSSGFSYTSSV